MIVAALAGACVAIGLPPAAQAQSPTPTETATVTPTASITLTPTATCTPLTSSAPCTGAKKVQLRWLSKDPLTVRAFVSATHCEAPASCEVFSGTTATSPPITVTVTDTSGHVLSKTITDPGVNVNGCPGGKDTYRGPTDRFRFVFGAATTVVGKLRMPQPNPTPPALTPPLKFTVRDSCGYSVEGTVSTCFTKQSSLGTYVKCF